MTMNQKQQVALFRYGVIAPLETGTSDPSISNNEFFRRAAQKTYTGPDGKEITVAAGTIEKWHLAYSKGGFNALLPHSRKDEGISRSGIQMVTLLRSVENRLILSNITLLI